jgi:hypothetical protein
MVESVEPRTGLGPHPVLGEAPAPPDSSTLATINGHEYLYPDQDNLQYACTFPLGSSRECTPGSGSCPCPFDSSTGLTTSPLCLSPDTGEYGPTQYFAPAYPGLRLLDVLKSYGYNSVVASACPKITDPDRADDPSYGYLPAMEALIGRAVPKLAPPCLPRALPLDADGAIACRIAEVSETSANVSCDSGGRKDADEAFAAVVLDHLESRRLCDGDRVPCSEMVVCELQPAADLDGCLNDSSPAGSGYCYIDAMRDLNGDGAADCDLDGGDSGDCLGNPALVAECPESERRLLRFVGDVPARDALLVIGCVGAGSW